MTDRTVVYRLRAELTQFRAQMAQGSASVKKFGDDLTKVDASSAKVRRGLDSVGRGAGIVGAVAAAGLAAAVLKAADFDQAMSNVQAATHESTANMEALRDAAIEAGQRTVFSATESAGAIENLAKAGVSTKDILAGGLNGALDLASAGSLEVADAAEIAATALTQFGLSGKDVPHVADLLAAGAGKAQGEVSDLSMALKQSGLVAAQMGVSIEETVGSLSAFASAGLLGSDAGTSFRTMLLRLANPSKQAKEAMESLGISAYDMKGNFVGIDALAGQLQQAFKGQSQATRDAALATIFGSDAIRAANVLYKQGAQGIDDWTNKVNDAGYAAETAATRLDNLKGDLEQFRGSLETALIGTGESAQGPLRSLVQNATDVVNAYNNLPGPIKSSVTKVLATTALLGGGAFVFTKLVGGVSSARTALENLGVSSAKTTRAMKGLAYAGAALVALDAAGAAIESLQRKIDGTLPGVDTLTSRLLDLQKGSVENLGAQFDDLAESIDRMSNKSAQQHFSDFMSGVFDPVVPWDDRAKGLREATGEVSALDAALANIVTVGTPEQAAQTFDALTKSAHLSADQIADLRRNLPQYREALAGVANQSELSATSVDATATATDRLGRSVTLTADDLKAMSKALKEDQDNARNTAQQFVGLGNSLDKSKVSLNAWIRQMAKQADALHNFRVNAEDAAKNGLDKGLIASLEEAGPAGALRMKQLADATKVQIAEANKAWREGQREVDKYVKATVHIPKALVTHIDVDSDRAERLLKRLQDFKFSTKIIPIETARSDGSGVAFQHGGVRGSADGSTVPRVGGYFDKFPYLLAPGEEVISNRYGQADRWRPLLKMINAGRLANGGTVRPSAAAATVQNILGGPSIDYNRLAQAVANARPLYGDVHVSGDPTTFKRQLQADHQQAALGGRRVG